MRGRLCAQAGGTQLERGLKAQIRPAGPVQGALAWAHAFGRQKCLLVAYPAQSSSG